VYRDLFAIQVSELSASPLAFFACATSSLKLISSQLDIWRAPLSSSTTQPHPWFENGEEFPNEDILLEDGNVVPKVCFGVVSLLNPSRITKTNANSLM
jgi:hypothetical protein